MPGRGPGSRRGKPCRDHLGNEYKSQTAMALAYGLSPACLAHRLRTGLQLEEALTAAHVSRDHDHPCEDHLGNEYPSINALCRVYNINYTVYDYRLNTRGWSLEKTLTTPVSDSDLAGAHPCEDHLGNKFPSIKAMCEHWRIPRTAFFNRRKAGKTLEECLAPVQENHRRVTQARSVKDHLGNAYPSFDAMLEHYHITKSEYTTNIRNNLPLDRALTERTVRPKRPKDHKGNEYPSINAMCRAYGIDKTVLRSRLELGWTLGEILEHPEDNSHYIECEDHLGNKYPSQRAMLAEHGVSYVTFKHRLGKGSSLAEALSARSLHMRACTDHEGREFPCLQAMTRFWHCRTSNWHHRTGKQGMSLKASLETPSGPIHGVSVEKVYELDGRTWYDASWRRRRALLPPDRFQELMALEALLEMLEDREVPDGMSLRHISDGWFLVAPDGQPPAVKSARAAWYDACVAKYRRAPEKEEQEGDAE